MNVIANKKGTDEWFICEIDGRKESKELSELAKEKDILKLYEPFDLESQYFTYYKLKRLPPPTNQGDKTNEG